MAVIFTKQFGGTHMYINERIEGEDRVLTAQVGGNYVATIRLTKGTWVVESSIPLQSPIHYARCQSYIANKLMSYT